MQEVPIVTCSMRVLYDPARVRRAGNLGHRHKAILSSGQASPETCTEEMDAEPDSFRLGSSV